MTDLVLPESLRQAIDAVPSRFPALAHVDEIHARCLAMTVASPEDAAGLKTAQAARREARKVRSQIETLRKELKAGSLAYGRAVDGAAALLRGPLEEVEAHLKEQLATVERVLAQRKAEKLSGRLHELAEVGVSLPDALVEAVADDDWDVFFEGQATAAEERRKLDEERAALARERAELEATMAKLQAQSDAEVARAVSAPNLAADILRPPVEGQAPIQKRSASIGLPADWVDPPVGDVQAGLDHAREAERRMVQPGLDYALKRAESNWRAATTQAASEHWVAVVRWLEAGLPLKGGEL